MNEITYILGAGASYYSMPLVEDFPNRFNYFLDFIRPSISSDVWFMKDCEKFASQLESHVSFDTIFKKLFHQNSSNRIRRYKAILLIYFIFEHLYFTSNNQDKRISNKKYVNDPRYEALIAGLLKPVNGKCEFFSKVNFLSWNYDLNLLYSMKNFMFENDDIPGILKQYEVSINQIVFNDAQLINLNGKIQHPLLKHIDIVNESDLKNLLVDLIKRYKDDTILDYADLIVFSWESIGNSNIQAFPNHILKAQEAVSKSSVIIVIGYSFPLYNRPIDTFILNRTSAAGKKIVIQDPYAEDYKDILLNDFEILDANVYGEGTYFVTKQNCKSFYIPNKIFTNQ